MENLIPFRDKVAFVCVLKSDVNKMIKELREGLKLSVNIVHSSSDVDIRSFRNPIPIEQLRPLGFYAYANSLFTGPEPIMKYLCKTYSMHCTPIGDETVNSKYEDVPNKIQQFFSGNYYIYGTKYPLFILFFFNKIYIVSTPQFQSTAARSRPGKIK